MVMRAAQQQFELPNSASQPQPTILVPSLVQQAQPPPPPPSPLPTPPPSHPQSVKVYSQQLEGGNPRFINSSIVNDECQGRGYPANTARRSDDHPDKNPPEASSTSGQSMATAASLPAPLPLPSHPPVDRPPTVVSPMLPQTPSSNDSLPPVSLPSSFSPPSSDGAKQSSMSC